MKKLLQLFAIAFIASSCSQNTTFTIKGTTNISADSAYLHVNSNIVASAPIVNNQFEFTGNIDTIAFAEISVQNSGASLILESGQYKAFIDIDEDNIVEGPDNQTVFNKINSYNVSKIDSLYGLYRQAVESESDQVVLRYIDEINDQAEVRLNYILDWCNSNADSPVAIAFIYTFLQRDMSIDELKNFSSRISEKGSKFYMAKLLAQSIAELELILPGHVAPDFTLPTIDGDSIVLSNVKAKVKVLDFWASWCGPCRAGNPTNIQIYNQLHSKGLEVIGISGDTEFARWADAVKQDGLPWINVCDFGGKNVFSKYCINSIPTCFLLDENNVIIDCGAGLSDFSQTIEQLLNK